LERFRRHPALVRALRWLVWFMLQIRFFAFFRDRWFSKRMKRFATQNLHDVIADPALRAKLTPDYAIGCKRILISDDYYQTLVRPNVEVVTDPIARIERAGVVTADGRERRADVLIHATGFETTTCLAPLAIEGRRGAKLHLVWRHGGEGHPRIRVARR